MIIDNMYTILAIYLDIEFDYLGRINIFNFAKQLPRPAMNFETELSNSDVSSNNRLKIFDKLVN